MEQADDVHDAIITGILPLVMDILRKGDPSLRSRAASEVSGFICDGTFEHVMLLINHGMIESLFDLMKTKNKNTISTALDALSNMLFVIQKENEDEIPKIAEIVVNIGGIEQLKDLQSGKHIEFFEISTEINNRLLLGEPIGSLTIPTDSDEPKKKFACSIICSFGNLCDSLPYQHPPPSMEMVKRALPYLKTFLQCGDDYICAQSCKALRHLMNRSRDHIKAIVKSGAVMVLMDMLKQASQEEEVESILSLIVTIAKLNDKSRDAIIEVNGLEHIAALLKHSSQKVVQLAARVIGNITSGNKQHVQHVINAGVHIELLKVLYNGDDQAKMKAAKAIAHLTFRGSDDQLSELFSPMLIEALYNALINNHSMTLNYLLDVHNNLLRSARRQQQNILELMIDIDGLLKFQALRFHRRSEIRYKVHLIINAFFPEEKDEVFAAKNKSEQINYELQSAALRSSQF